MTVMQKTLTEPSRDWVKTQITTPPGTKQKITTEAPVNNHPTRCWEGSTEIRTIRAKLIEGENSGFIRQSPEEILAEFKAELKQYGRL